MLADAVEVAHNVSLDNINNDDIIQERKFVSGGKLPVIQESAFVTQINEHEKQMTKAEHARIQRASRRNKFEEMREKARQNV